MLISRLSLVFSSLRFFHLDYQLDLPMLYSGNAAFFYGVYVESARLCFAAEAYSKQKKSIHALNLISARQRNNLLRRVGDSKGSVTKVSDQIWKMIKVEIIRIAMNKAERNDLKGNRNGKASWEEIESTSELKSAYGGHGKNSAIEMMLYRREGVSFFSRSKL